MEEWYIYLVRKTVFYILVVVVTGLLVYSNTFEVPFHFDDRGIFVNQYVKDLQRFFDLDPEGAYHPLKDPRYLGHLTISLNYNLHGFSVGGYHTFNLAVHIASAILVFFLALLVLRDGWEEDNRRLVAFFAALLFVSHPVQTQSVTYIAQRFTSLAAMFFLLSVVLYGRWRVSGSALLYAAALVATVLSAKSKEIAFTLPVVLGMYEILYQEGKKLKRFLYILPFALAVLLIPLSHFGIPFSQPETVQPVEQVAEVTGGVEISEVEETQETVPLVTRWTYLATQFRVITTYMRLLFLPVNQNLDYDYPAFSSFMNAQVLFSFLLLLIVLCLGCYLAIRKGSGKAVAFGVFWFFITLAVESSVIPIADVIVEHRVYLPSVGALIAVMSLVGLLSSSLYNRSPLAGRAVVPMLAAVALCFSSLTYARNVVWQDELSMWKDVARKSPNKVRPYNNLGFIYENRGMYDDAVWAYKRVLGVDPYHPVAHNNLGVVYDRLGRYDEAENEYRAALRSKPGFDKAHNNLGALLYRQGDYEEAVKEFLAAVDINLHNVVALNNVGMAYEKIGDFDNARWGYLIATKMDPNFFDPHYRLAMLNDRYGEYEDAVLWYREALRIRPDVAGAHNNLGVIFERKGQYEEAAGEYRAALGIEPDNTSARANLNRILRVMEKNRLK
jgi:Flp pilus assembly protein TadD